MSPLLVDAKTAAARIGVTHWWLADQARAGKVPHHRIGRRRKFSDDDITQIVAMTATQAADPWARSAQSQSRRGRTA